VPQLVPAEDPELLGTAFGLLTNELARSPEATIDAVLQLLEQARASGAVLGFFAGFTPMVLDGIGWFIVENSSMDDLDDTH